MITIDQKIAEYLSGWAPGGWPVGNFILVTIALLLSVILCGAVGFEREWKGRSAGLRTHMLVGVGSCIIMIISIYGFPKESGARDVARLAAQIITGVGFLGAGTIIHQGGGIRGLTTAATIWIVMAIGIACGSFNFILAIVGTILILFVLTVFRKIVVKINKKNPVVTIVSKPDEPILEKIMRISKNFECNVQELTTEIEEDAGEKVLRISFQAIFMNDKPQVGEYVSQLEKETNAINVHVSHHR